ncbi:MAG: aspartate kinase [Bacteroidales bacterium]|jgi:aspartate kinase|nr:aspartate kinase [Bacteroidales bacterium]
MKIFKFGGASVKDAQSVRNVVNILERYDKDQLFVVLSAMGKNTNELEMIVQERFFGNDVTELLDAFKERQCSIARALIPEHSKNIILPAIGKLLTEIDRILLQRDSFCDFDAFYDSVVSFGEVLSTQIMHQYLNYCGKENVVINAFDWVKTDDYFRFAKVDMESSSKKLREAIRKNNGKKIFLTQGFIGANEKGYPTTLGREGSDYTAALAGAILEAESVTVWKDVPGLLNADPKRMENLQKINRISYREAIELAYYGAKVIHPKTIKPIENKSIPLYIKSFLDTDSEGTLIHHTCDCDDSVPFFIFHENQMLVSISVKDMSFVTEESLHHTFGILNRFRIRIHLMQISAVSFSICIDNDKSHCKELIQTLQKDYTVKYNTDLELISIRHYHNVDIEEFMKDREILLEQRSRSIAQFVVR